MITFEGSEQLQTRLKTLVFEIIDVFATKVRKEPAAVEPMKIVIELHLQSSSTSPTLGREAEGDTNASRCLIEVRRRQRVAGQRVESSTLSN